MKKHLLLLFFLSLISCDPSSTGYVLIENQRNVEGEITFYTSDEHIVEDTFKFYANDITEIFHMSALGVTNIHLSFEDDSIIIRFDDDKYIRYYKDSVTSGKKTIYRESDWKIDDIGRNTEFTFTVTDVDVSMK